MEHESSSESFEEAFKTAENAVESLERGELPLEECLQRYEEGLRAIRHCHSLLEQALKRVEVLSASGPTADSTSSSAASSGSGEDPDVPGDAASGARWESASSVKPLKEALERIDREQLSSSGDE